MSVACFYKKNKYFGINIKYFGVRGVGASDKKEGLKYADK